MVIQFSCFFDWSCCQSHCFSTRFCLILSRSHLRDIRDRSVLRLFESSDMMGGVLPGAGVGVAAPVHITTVAGGAPPHAALWDQDQSYFSEPEFDSEYQHQHIHKSKVGLVITNALISSTSFSIPSKWTL